MEAIRMVEQGVASPRDIDTAMELGYRHPVGPLKLTDMVGLDVRMNIGEYLARELGNPAFEPPALMRKMVAEGKLGKARKGKPLDAVLCRYDASRKEERWTFAEDRRPP